MKKTMKTLLALMAGVMTFSACSNEDVLTNETPNVKPEVEGIRTFTAFTESDGATRATIDGFDVKWQENDEIVVMNEYSHITKFTLDEGANTTSGTFTGSIIGSDIYAVYPYAEEEVEVTWDLVESIANEIGLGPYYEAWDGDPHEYGEDDNFDMLYGAIGDVIDALFNGGTIKENPTSLEGSTIKDVILPYIQKVAAGQVVDPKAVLMAAKADDVDNLAFKNICAYIKVTTTTPCASIQVWGHSGEDVLTATLDVDMSSGTPTISNHYNNSGSVRLQAAEGNLAPGTYYIAVLPGTLTNGLEVRFYTSEYVYSVRSIDTSFTFERNKVYNAGSQADATPITKGGARDGEDMVRFWTQLWAGGPRFADTNVSGTKTFAQATASPWGSNWALPSKDDLDELVKAASSTGSEKVDCEYTQESGTWGFKFTGKEAGYTENSVFFPAPDGESDYGYPKYWSGTAKGSSMGWIMDLNYDDGNCHSTWNARPQNNDCLVRLVLVEN